MNIYLKALEHDMKLLELYSLAIINNWLDIEISKERVFKYIYRID